jgi:hypothetical protein
MLCSCVVTTATPTYATLITDGFTFAVASTGANKLAGNHFHSNTGGSYGNPAGKAEVGRFSSEEVRGLSEYDLTGLSAASAAYVTFNIFKAGGLFAGTNDFPFTGNINILSYVGNNLEDISDYQAASTWSVGTFGTTGLVAGNVLSFDITSIFNDAISMGETSLGIRLQANPRPETGAWTFNSFRLTTDNQTTGSVPEPASLALFGFGLVGLAFLRRSKKSRFI